MKKVLLFSLVGISKMINPVCCGRQNVQQPEKPAVVHNHNVRTPSFPINHLFLHRWSSRAFSGESITDQELMMLFEAARWAPSSFNEQPWHFLYAKREDPYWQDFFNLLVPFNQEWAQKTAVLVLVLSRTNFSHNGQPNQTHEFDTGAAWMQLALQGHSLGLVVHGMAGFDYQKAREDLRIPDCYAIHAMVAIGRPGKKEDLPQALQEKEMLSSRKKIDEFITHGPYLNC